MNAGLEQYLPLAETISMLFFPHVEVVLHDLSNGCIGAIFNNLSKRSVGEESLLDEVSTFSQLQDIFPPYLKMNWDGRKMKSVSTVLRDSKTNAPIGLLCMNLDISQWEKMHQLIGSFIRPVINPPEVLFKNDWKEKINIYVSTYLKKHSMHLEFLNKSEKKQLLIALRNEGAFETKNAASYIADVLQISRATVYNYLKDEQ
jgi:predicted transcriptional regulator YheO